jgi:cytidine deaminase
VDDELTAAERHLIAAARDVSGRAYAPASGFAVGCAVLTGSGRTFVGCNVENASYGLTICAERAAIAAAVAAEGPRPRITAVAVHAYSASCSPCGACRQVIAELGPEATVVYRRDGRLVRRPIAELLPDAFTLPG